MIVLRGASLGLWLSAAVACLGCGARTGLVCDLDGCHGAVVPGEDGGSDVTTPGDDAFSPTDDGGFVFDAPTIDSGPVGTDLGLDLGVDAPIDTTCPRVLPKDGSACSGVLDCEYVGCDLSKNDRASCTAGKWGVVASACAPASDRCPMVRPILGSSCSLASSSVCWYSTKCPASEFAYCASGKWSGKYGGCLSPDTCPTTFPTKGSACTISSDYQCNYLNACGVPEWTLCAFGRWGGGAPDPESLPIPCETTPGCPSTEPAVGSSCTPPKTFTVCVWKNDCGGVDYGACGWLTGKPNTWTVVRPACVAPGCPTTPTEGSSCSSESLSCTYPIGGGCTLVCSCATGTWACTQPPCGSSGK